MRPEVAAPAGISRSDRTSAGATAHRPEPPRIGWSDRALAQVSAELVRARRAEAAQVSAACQNHASQHDNASLCREQGEASQRNALWLPMRQGAPKMKREGKLYLEGSHRWSAASQGQHNLAYPPLVGDGNALKAGYACRNPVVQSKTVTHMLNPVIQDGN